MTEGAPQAIQVADRFHLVQNLSETLERTLTGYAADLKAIEQDQHQAVANRCPDTVVATPQPTATVKAAQQTQDVHQQRIEPQKTIKALQAQGWSQDVIAQAVGVSIRTVQRYLSQPDLSDSPPRRSTLGQGILDPYKPQVLQWWNDGIRQPHALMVLLQQQGFTGSERTLQRYLKGLRSRKRGEAVPPRGYLQSASNQFRRCLRSLTPNALISRRDGPLI
jgi:hypothetical protein